MNLLEIMGCCIPKDEQKKIKFTEVQEFHLKKKKRGFFVSGEISLKTENNLDIGFSFP